MAENVAPAPLPPEPPKHKSSVMIWVVVAIALCCGGFVIVAIIAAIAIPGLLAAQRASNERHAGVSMRTLTTAEADFRSMDRDGNGIADFWVGDVRSLYYMPGPGGEIKLIEPSTADADVSAGGKPKQGYRYGAIPMDENGEPFDHGNGRNRNRFAFCAWPESYPSAGKLTFIVNEDGSVWKKDTRGEPVLQWPANPMLEGWRLLD